MRVHESLLSAIEVVEIGEWTLMVRWHIIPVYVVLETMFLANVLTEKLTAFVLVQKQMI